MTSRRVKYSKKNGVVLKLAFYLYIVFSLFATVSLRTAVFNLEYELGEMDRLRAGLVGERKMIVAQRANYYATQRVEDVAIKRLGMTLPDRENVFFVSETAVAGPYRASMKHN